MPRPRGKTKHRSVVSVKPTSQGGKTLQPNQHAPVTTSPIERDSRSPPRQASRETTILKTQRNDALPGTTSACTSSLSEPLKGSDSAPQKNGKNPITQTRSKFSTENPNFSSFAKQMLEAGTTVLEILKAAGILVAGMKHHIRGPPLRSHPQTRADLRDQIAHWLSDEHRQWNMLWVHGVSGVGKSVIAQSIADYAKSTRRFGAAFFFSQEDACNDAGRVIPTLAYQLALHSPAYKRLLTQILVDDSTIPEKSIREQFNGLIIEPFATLKRQNSPLMKRPLLILLDGLNECEDEEAQCEFLELISEFVRTVPEFPLLWMICSRPEWHFSMMLSRVDFEITCGREEIFIDPSQAHREVYRVLEGGFRDIRLKHLDCFSSYGDGAWPSTAQLLQIASTAPSLPVFTSTILRLVGNPLTGNPITELEQCLRFIGSNHIQSVTSPLHALDLIYRGVVSTIARDNLPIAGLILGTTVFSHNPLPSLRVLANFLSFTPEQVYSALAGLESVVYVPHPDDADSESLRLHDESFGEFLKDRTRSGNFCVDAPQVHRNMALRTLSIFNAHLDNRACWFGTKISRCTCPPTELEAHVPLHRFPYLSWDSELYSVQHEVYVGLTEFVQRECWSACCRTTKEDEPLIIAEIENFPFRFLETQDLVEKSGFTEFLNWLSARHPSIIRKDPMYVTDALLVERVESYRERVFLHVATGRFQFAEGPKCSPEQRFFLGIGAKACLAIYHSANTARRLWMEYFLQLVQNSTEDGTVITP